MPAGGGSAEPDHGDDCRVSEVLATQLSTETGTAGENCRQGDKIFGKFHN
jgi:hypothetical protein